MEELRRPEATALLGLTVKFVARALPASSRQPRVTAVLMAAILKHSLHGTANCHPYTALQVQKGRPQRPRLRHVTRRGLSSRTLILRGTDVSIEGYGNEICLRLKELDPLSWRESGPPR